MFGAIVLAGGKGSRFTKQKQFCEFRGKVLWKHVYDKIIKFVPKENVVVVGVDVPGGQTRSYSVMNGLNYLKDKNISKVIILEAARPLVTEKQINMILTKEGNSVSFARPLVNTIIKKDGTYVNRSEYYDLLTPQCFSFNELLVAYDSGHFTDMTDETRVMYEFYGVKAELIEGDDHLFKVTYPHDLAMLESISQRSEDE